MDGPGRPSDAVSVGIRRGLLALVWLATLAPAGAHGPVEKQLKRDLPPGVVVPPGPPASPDALRSGVDVRPSARPLRQLALEAPVIVVGDVLRTEPYDDDRLHVHRVRTDRVLRGDGVPAELGVVDVRGDSHRPPLLVDGERLVLFLRPAPRQSYLQAQLGDAVAYELLARRDAVVPVTAESDVEVVAQLVAGASSGGGSEEAAIAQRRTLALASLASRNPRLVLDAAGEFGALAGWPPLLDPEVAAIAAALRDARIPTDTRVRWLELLGERKANQALAGVLGAATDTAEALDAVLRARAALGSPIGRADLAAYLSSEEAPVRAAALRALAALGDPSAITDLGRAAMSDRETSVRAAAIDALGTTKAPAAVPVLAQTFDGDDRDLRQHAGRALLAVGGEAADQSLVDLALKGKTLDSQKYAALLLVVARGREHPAVQRLLAGKPSGDVREVIEHGLEFQHMHRHD